MKHLLFLLSCLLFFSFLSAQDASVDPNIFNRLTQSAKDFKLDTSTAPADKLTQKIVEFRNLRGGFNINEAILYKFQEEEAKATDTASKEAVAKMKAAFYNGNGKRWMDNAVINIYRNNFTYKEMKQLVKFYKTTAGQNWLRKCQ